MIRPVLFLIVLFVIYLVYSMSPAMAGGIEGGIPRPPHPPRWTGRWASIGEWAVPFSVRYAVAYCDDEGRVGPMSAWTPYYYSVGYSNPVLTGFPEATGLVVYRQFESGDIENVGVLTNTSSNEEWIDRHR